MEERCVFCGAAIPAGAMYCQDCATIVEGMTDDQRKALAAMVADEKELCTVAQAWEQIKEAMAFLYDCVVSAIICVVSLFVEIDDQQRER